ncbi:hypothetical protein [Prosthecobacter sp.]|uniref:hypothetical protein n=1 Tax=Prosthecobacter sp. TaxID=1965333 RepID=UPI0037851F0B
MITISYLQAILYGSAMFVLACYALHKRMLNLELNRQLKHALGWIRKHMPAQETPEPSPKLES